MMNATQLRYAKERVSSVRSEKLSALRSAYGSTRFSDKEKLAALKKGEFEINKKATHLNEALVFPNAPTEMSSDDYQSAVHAIEARATSIMDELILGDHEIALKLIQAFRSEA